MVLFGRERKGNRMLQYLHVKNLALIEEVEVDFAKGLNILTGETGAGKSIIIGSINLALGQRVSREMIRDEEKPALVELVFHVREACKKTLEALDISMEDNQVILSRKITGARSVCKINGETVPVHVMKQAAQLLIDIHGQHEHQSLLHKEKHLEIVDAFSKEDSQTLLSSVKNTFAEYETCKKKLEDFQTDEAGRQREITFLQYEVDEIVHANLKEGEDEQLETEYRRMVNGRKIAESLNEIYQLMAADGITDRIGTAGAHLAAVKQYDESLEDLSSQIQEIELLLTDFNRDVNNYIRDLEFDEERFREVQERLDEINHLKTKYGNSVDEIVQYAQKQEEKLKQLLEYEETLEALRCELDSVEGNLQADCEKLTKIRKQHGKELVERIKKHLADLNFTDVQFELDFQKIQSYRSNGWDEVEFLISTNPGEPVRPLGKVASGGELSRIMLAIKTVLADKDEIETLIFDEIDVGISGRTAQKVSEKMAVIGKNRQVICITHLPQIASMADCHFCIEKKVENQETLTYITNLDEERMIEELARMLGGAQITQMVLDNAGEMKAFAKLIKENL